MASVSNQITAVSVVTVGQFNPAIVHPAWLAAEGLITKPEAEGTAIEVVHPEFAQFTFSQEGAAMRVQVLRERLMLTTEDARLYEGLRDLTMGILTLLRHTPVTKLGINFDTCIAMDSEDARNGLGRRLAPAAPWSGILDGAAMLSLSMRTPRVGGNPGHTVIRVEPSVRLAFGVLIALNEHYDIDALQPDSTTGTERVVDVLKQTWDATSKRAREITSKLTVPA